MSKKISWKWMKLSHLCWGFYQSQENRYCDIRWRQRVWVTIVWSKLNISWPICNFEHLEQNASINQRGFNRPLESKYPLTRAKISFNPLLKVRGWTGDDCIGGGPPPIHTFSWEVYRWFFLICIVYITIWLSIQIYDEIKKKGIYLIFLQIISYNHYII